MKKILISVVTLVTTSLFFSCGSDDDGGGGVKTENTELSGNLTENRVLDASETYQLTSGYVVENGATLTIPAGTRIEAAGGTGAYIAVSQGAKINIEGTQSNPVVMTSANSSPAPGDWGGLVICGQAPTNVGTTATSEVAELTYGGNVADDNSGSIRYLRLEYTGASFNESKQFNGLSLFGVGSGTTVEYVQAYENGDDGIEFFGGTVTGDYLVSTNSADDSIDFADGWAGSGDYWYISGCSKAGIEGSNNGDNGDATPVTDASLSNVSIVGPFGESALYYKEGGGNFTIDNLFVANDVSGVAKEDVIYLKTSDTPAVSRLDAGDLIINGLNATTTLLDNLSTEYDFSGSTSITFDETGTGAGSGASAPAWTEGWTVGLDNSDADVLEVFEGSVLSGTLDSAFTLDAGVDYSLSESFVILDGGSLTIPAGTRIEATGGTGSYMAVAQGGQIFINGTATNPVVMTSSNASPAPADWGGLVICGQAPTNVGTTATSEVAELTYGGDVSDDNSGVIRYLRLEYTGASFNESKQFNGLSLFGVGSGTTVEYVQAYENGDDGIEFFGGTVTGDYLVSTNSADDSIDFADGWAGTGSYWYITGCSKAGIEGSNNGDNGDATPVTTASISNISIVGPFGESAIYYKEGGGNVSYSDVYVSGATAGAKTDVIYLKTDDTPAIARLDAGDLSIVNLDANLAKADLSSEYDFTSYTNITEATSVGAGNGADAPDWTAGWTAGL